MSSYKRNPRSTRLSPSIFIIRRPHRERDSKKKNMIFSVNGEKKKFIDDRPLSRKNETLICPPKTTLAGYLKDNKQILDSHLIVETN